MPSTLRNLRKAFPIQEQGRADDGGRVLSLPSASATVLELILKTRITPAGLLELAYYAAEDDLARLMRAAGALDPGQRAQVLRCAQGLARGDPAPAKPGPAG